MKLLLVIISCIVIAYRYYKRERTINKNIKEANARGEGIWINGKKHPLG